LVLTIGMGFMLLSWIPLLSTLLGWVLGGLVFLLNWLVGLIKFLPFPGMVDLHIPVGEVIMIYLIMVFVFGVLVQRNWRFALPLMAAIVALLSFETIQRWEHLHQNGIIVYQMRKHTAIRVYDGRESRLLLDEYLLNHSEQASFVVDAVQSRLGLKRTQWLTLFSDTLFTEIERDTIVGFHYETGKRLMIVGGEQRYFPLQKPIDVDVLILAQRPQLEADRLLDIVKPSQIVVDGSVSFRFKEEIKRLADENKINYYDTSVDGAFVVRR